MLIFSPSAGKTQDLDSGLFMGVPDTAQATTDVSQFRFGPDLGGPVRSQEQISADEFIARTGVDIHAPAPPKMGEPGPPKKVIEDLLSEREKHVQYTQALIDAGAYEEARAMRATIEATDLKLEAAIARQAIEEARDFYAPQRLNAIWSDAENRNYEFVPVAEGVYDVYVDGQLQFPGMSMDQIAEQTLMMTDQAYAQRQEELAQKEAEAYATSLGASQGGLLGAQQQAVSQEDADSQNSLGLIYSNGTGVAQDYVTAHMWFNIAGANGSSDATENRDRIATLMTPTDLSEAQRRAKACMASNYQDCD